jgi:CRP-like cAMP-binding protein
LRLPVEAVTETFAILAKRGVGKTYTASVFAEELVKASLPVAVLDPIGVWWGLRSSADGKSAGLPIVIMGGRHGDVPLESTGGQVVADFLVDDRASVVIDLSEFRKGEQRRFVTDFAEQLYHRNREALHLILDEADAFAPQRPMKDQARMLGAVEDLVRRGRARGIGVTLVTQRSAVLNKDVLTQAEVLVAMRTIAPQDRDAVDEWIKVHGDQERRREVMDSLPSLPIGTAWVWSPGWLDVFKRVEIRRRETFDSSATPKAGASKPRSVKLADVDLEGLRVRMSATIERAKAEDPRELRKTITGLRRELTKARKQPPVMEAKVEERVVEVPVFTGEELRVLRDLGESISSGVEQVTALVSAAMTKTAIRRNPTSKLAPSRVPPKPSSALALPTADQAGRLRKGERKMLEVLARHNEFRVTRAQLGTLAGYAPSGGTFTTYLGVLKRNGLATEEHGIVTITDQGLDHLGVEIPSPQTTQEVLAHWLSALRKGERSMLRILVEAYPGELTRETLAEMAGYEVSGGTFSTYLGVLRRNGLIVVDGDSVRASETLFLG